jgi:hypothetical protein
MLAKKGCKLQPVKLLLNENNGLYVKTESYGGQVLYLNYNAN